MRKTALLLVIAVFGYAANAQFTLRPQFGFEHPVTKVSYNNASAFSPTCQLSVQAGVRADYSFKGGFGTFLGVFTHRPLVTYSFKDPEAGMTAYDASIGDLRMQIQGGLQYSSKPIALSKNKSTSQTKTESTTPDKSICGSYHSSACHKNSSSSQTNSKNNWTLRLQPFAGVAYIPSSKQDLEIQTTETQPTYVYNAGNIKSEFITGLGFEFAKNKTKFLSVSFNYFKGLGNNVTSFTTESSTKTVNTTLGYKVSGFSASIGVPISFQKSKSSLKSTSSSYKNPYPEKSYNQRSYHHHCGEYFRTRCGHYIKI